jgi:hypothetical protein
MALGQRSPVHLRYRVPSFSSIIAEHTKQILTRMRRKINRLVKVYIKL